MTNLERLKLEIQQSGFSDPELSIFLKESNLSPTDTFNTSSNDSKRNNGTFHLGFYHVKVTL